jgi:hypothetical protein
VGRENSFIIEKKLYQKRQAASAIRLHPAFKGWEAAAKQALYRLLL